MEILYIIIGIIITTIFYAIFNKKEINRIIDKKYNEYINIKTKEIEEITNKKLILEQEKLDTNLKEQYNKYESELQRQQSRYEIKLQECSKINNLLIAAEEEKVETAKKNTENTIKLLELRRKDKIDSINKELDKEIEKINSQKENKIHAAEIECGEIIEGLEKIKQEKTAIIQKEIEDFISKRNALNEAIRIENEEKNSILNRTIQLSNENKQDIEFLLSLENKFNNKQVIYKLIWTEYLQKPFNDMVNRIFGSNIPSCVIYCIENINTHQKYIGKTTTEVSKRWTEHIKASLNISQIAKQNVHKALFGHWDEFVFSVVEITTKEKVTQREKFYIDTFQSDKYGYNMMK